MHVMVPTTDLTNEYHEALNCALTGMTNFAFKPPAPVPGVYDAGALVLGIDRYRYPQDLPKVAANRRAAMQGPVAARVQPRIRRRSSRTPARTRPATAIRASC